MSDASEQLAEAMQTNGITIDTEFIPWSQSLSAKPTPKMSDRSLNWRVILKHNGRDVYVTYYTAGIGHCPSYSQNMKPTLYNAERIARETETGRSATIAQKPIKPSIPEVFASLLNDGEAVEYSRFEDWAAEWGYEMDSRKAEATYRECLACGLALRAAFGDALLNQLREITREM